MSSTDSTVNLIEVTVKAPNVKPDGTELSADELEDAVRTVLEANTARLTALGAELLSVAWVEEVQA